MSGARTADLPVGIVGAGPVGLALALALSRLDIDVRVFERRADAKSGSRSIGIHPPSLELLDELGVVSRFLERGVRVTRGLAFGATQALGAIDFSRCPGRYPFILSIPQEETEAILREALLDRAPRALRVGAVSGARTDGDGVTLTMTCNGETSCERVSLLVGADGKSSTIRQGLGIGFEGRAYDGEYVMGDFPDTTRFGDDAAVFLHPEGLVECFPLPKATRRWVVRLGPDRDASAPALIDAIEARTTHRLRAEDASRWSSFRAEHYLAQRFSRGRVALVGDSAHVVSPIGGQGMNLGWLGARSLARTIEAIVRGEEDAEALLARNAAARRRVAKAAARRAEVNMWLGRPLPQPGLRERLVHGLLASPASGILARMFTMRGLTLGV